MAFDEETGEVLDERPERPAPVLRGEDADVSAEELLALMEAYVSFEAGNQPTPPAFRAEDFPDVGPGCAAYMAEALNAHPRLLDEVARWREDMNQGVDALLAKWATEGVPHFCPHCGATFPKTDEAEAHARDCMRNPRVAAVWRAVHDLSVLAAAVAEEMTHDIKVARRIRGVRDDLLRVVAPDGPVRSAWGPYEEGMSGVRWRYRQAGMSRLGVSEDGTWVVLVRDPVSGNCLNVHRVSSGDLSPEEAMRAADAWLAEQGRRML